MIRQHSGICRCIGRLNAPSAPPILRHRIGPSARGGCVKAKPANSLLSGIGTTIVVVRAFAVPNDGGGSFGADRRRPIAAPGPSETGCQGFGYREVIRLLTMDCAVWDGLERIAAVELTVSRPLADRPPGRSRPSAQPSSDRSTTVCRHVNLGGLSHQGPGDRPGDPPAGGLSGDG